MALDAKIVNHVYVLGYQTTEALFQDLTKQGVDTNLVAAAIRNIGEGRDQLLLKALSPARHAASGQWLT
mgnify:CR=1 FL=1